MSRISSSSMEYKMLPIQFSRSYCTHILAITGAVFVFLAFGGVFFELIRLQNQVDELRQELQEVKPKLELHEKTLHLHEGRLKRIESAQTTNKTHPAFEYDTGSLNYDDYGDSYDDSIADTTDYPVSSDDYALEDIQKHVQSFRSKRDVLRRTLDGIPVNSESYEDVKRRNKTLKQLNKTRTSAPTQKTMDQGTPTPAMYSRRSRVFRMEDKSKAFRKIVTKSLLKSGDTTDQNSSESPVVLHRRRHRQRRVGSNEKFYRFRPVIHLSGNIYDANGNWHHNNHHFKNWSMEPWVKTLGMEEYFRLEDGHLRITEPGLYLIYAQVMYNDEHDVNGYGVYKNNEMVLQCTTTSHTSHRANKANSCFTAGVSYLNEGDKIKVHNLETFRYSVFRPGKSFFGAVKLVDIRITT